MQIFCIVNVQCTLCKVHTEWEQLWKIYDCLLSANFDIVLLFLYPARSFVLSLSLYLFSALHATVFESHLLLSVCTLFCACICVCVNNRRNKDWRNINYKLIELFSFIGEKKARSSEWGGEEMKKFHIDSIKWNIRKWDTMYKKSEITLVYRCFQKFCLPFFFLFIYGWSTFVVVNTWKNVDTFFFVETNCAQIWAKKTSSFVMLLLFGTLRQLIIVWVPPFDFLAATNQLPKHVWILQLMIRLRSEYCWTAIPTE